jgi:hypothetical protein
LKIPPKRWLRAAARHEYPEAEEAIPDAEGKLFSDSTLKWYLLHSCSLMFLNRSEVLAFFLTLSKTLIILFVIFEGFLLRTKVSWACFWVKVMTVVEAISSVLRVSPIESLMGMISL